MATRVGPHARPNWPTQNAWSFDYHDRDGRPHTITISNVLDAETALLVDGEVAPRECLKYPVQNPQDKPTGDSSG
jgi:hypothetical protein